MSGDGSQRASYCVGVGASAGGIEALGAMFSGAEKNDEICYVVVLHLSPDHPSRIVELLCRQTSLRVEPATDGALARGNTIYVVGPKATLRCAAQRLSVKPHVEARFHHREVDLLFESMAQHWGPRCAAVVLSGTGTDGARGARAVNESGGFIIAQRPSSASFDGMPKAVIATGKVDAVLPPAEICAELRELLTGRVRREPGEVVASREAEMSRIAKALGRHTGVDFSMYKGTSIARRIERRRGVVRAQTLGLYADLVEQNRQEAERLSSDLLIGVTQFFRERACIEEFTRALSAFVRERGGAPLRLWVAGCSTGEEAYTVAIVVSEVLRNCGLPSSFKLFATDINEGSLATASRGRYSAASVADVPADLMTHYFEPDPSGAFNAARFLRERILFARHDLLGDPPFSGIDIITCRNVFIHLVGEAQGRVSQIFGYALRRGGLLWLGSSETPRKGEYRFEAVSASGHVFRPVQAEAPSQSSLSSRPPPPFPSAPENPLALKVPIAYGPNASPLVDGHLFVDLAADLLPPHLIIDESCTLLYHSGGARRFLVLEDGPATLDVRKLLPSSLPTLLASAMDQQSSGEARDFLFPGIDLPGAKGSGWAMRVRRVLREPGREPLTAVFFEEVAAGERETNVVPAALATDAVQARVKSLERELERARAHLDATISKLEVSSEESQSTNEQLFASNEELQGVNEELQSVNEELHTVNVELQNKIEELSRVTADMDEVLAAVEMGIIVLDDELRIRRFNQRASAFVRVVAYDAGRPFSHLNNSFSGAPLLDDCARVARGLEPVERILFGDDGSKVLFKAKPMSQASNRGVLLSFSDLSSLESLEDRAHRLSAAVEQLDSPVVLVDPAGMITYANRCFAELARRDQAFLPGTALSDLMSLRSREDFERALERIRLKQTWRGTSELDIPDSSPLVEEVRLRPLLSKTGQVIGAARLSSSLPSVGRKVRILLVEDDPDDAELLSEQLDSNAMRSDLDSHRCAETALEALVNSPLDLLPDLILLDLGLPGMSGEDFISALRRTPTLAHIPILILTSSEDAEQVERAYTLGAAAYVVKPMDLEGFRQVLGRLEEFWFHVVRFSRAAAAASP